MYGNPKTTLKVVCLRYIFWRPKFVSWHLTLSLLSDQCQNSPAASQEIWHHTVWRTWLFIAYSDEKWLYYKVSLHHSYNCFLKGWENTLFELRSERVKSCSLMASWQLWTKVNIQPDQFTLWNSKYLFKNLNCHFLTSAIFFSDFRFSTSFIISMDSSTFPSAPKMSSLLS